MSTPHRPVSEVLAEHAPKLMALEGVVMVYEGALEDGRTCIKVGLASDSPELRERIPGELEGYPVVITVTGEIVPR